MQIKFIISNHSIRETTLCAAQTYGATSGGQQCLQKTAEVGGRAGKCMLRTELLIADQATDMEAALRFNLLPQWGLLEICRHS